MKPFDNNDNVHQDTRATSPEKYLLMDEKEKDAEIQKAVERLQRRIQEILYLLEKDRSHEDSMKAGEKMDSFPERNDSDPS